ncbi:MAG: hypothetical protein HY690_09225 [Chloroflexi bacterium]|nr:hypothetical protein [Chloroflexota bacterium]
MLKLFALVLGLLAAALVLSGSPPALGGSAGSDQVNATRQAMGLARVQRDPALDVIAAARARDMVQQGYFAHLEPGTGNLAFVQLLRAAGYRYQWAGEILCRGSQVERCYDGWLNSPSHRQILLEPAAQRYGLGTARGLDGREYAAVVFAR